MRVVGVDGCRGGWLAVIYDVAHGEKAVKAHTEPGAFQRLLAAYADAACITIDIPIGLAEGHPRPPDVEARKVLGPRARPSADRRRHLRGSG